MTAQAHDNLVTRRDLLRSAGCGFGYLAFQGLCGDAAAGAANPLAAKASHHAPRAKRVIFLFMHGGVSQVDSFDYKPLLAKEDGNELPFEPGKNLDAKTTTVMASPWSFAQHGQSGAWVSDLFPRVARHVDDMCIIKSMHTQGTSHGQAVCMLHTGADSLVRPSVGAWVSYGLGTENRDLPAFVSIAPPRGHGGPRNYGPAFLPASHQATTVGHSGMPAKDSTIRYLAGSGAERGRKFDLLQEMNRDHLLRAGNDPQIEGVIESYELAFRMQSAAPRVMEIDGEPRHIRDLYGIDGEKTDDFGRRCLLARRFAEAGVRYIQVSTPYVWDQHSNLKSGHEKNAAAVDQPIAGLLTDLKARGMLDDTLVLWGCEFGRTPIVQGKNGRDHNPQGFTVWMAGGGVKPGFSYGETDEYGYYAVKDKVHMHDLHATVLHLLGIDHEKLTYRYAGRDFRLTDVYGNVVHEVIA